MSLIGIHAGKASHHIIHIDWLSRRNIFFSFINVFLSFMVCPTVTGLDLKGLHLRYRSVLELQILNKEKTSLAQAMEKYGVARNTIRDFLGICELKILDKERYKAIIELEREVTGKPAVKNIEKRCRAVLSDYKAQSKRLKEEGQLLPFFPSESFYS